MKPKKIGGIVTCIVIILLLLTVVVTPVAATYNGDNGYFDDPPIFYNGPTGGGTDPGLGAFAGKFAVIICGSYGAYDWVEAWQHGKTLAESVSQVGVCHGYGAGPPYPETTFKIEIPAGTVVEGYYPGQGRVIYLEIKCVEGQLYFSPNLKLSQPATLYQLVDGEWVEVLTFTQVVDGKAS